MANTREINRRAERFFTKRQRLNVKGSYHDRLALPDDLDVYSRDAHVTLARRIPVESARSTPRGQPWLERHGWEPEDNRELGLVPSADWADDVNDPRRDSASSNAKTRQKGKKLPRRRPHLVWKSRYRDKYLDEMLRWEGRGDVRLQTRCPDCVSRNVGASCRPEYRCRDCFVPDLVCEGCCVRRHRTQPLHVIEKWNGEYFTKAALKSMGLVIQLGHVSMRCANPVPCPLNFQILHTNGIHDVSVSYCGCEDAKEKNTQLLRRGLYPATQKNVKTCASFVLLQLLHLLALTSKGSTYDFYRALEKATNNTGIHALKSASRYRPLLRMILQWRHLKMLKRGGRGHDPTGAAGTKDGELAVVCPSCPHPGINLPDGWEDVPEGESYLYSQILCMDANFRLKNQLVSSFTSDPGLGIGMAYMLPRAPYESYILSRTQDDDISTCVGLAALAKANTRFSKGLRYTGVGALSCGRSEMLVAKSVGNLQKGERYANMDYMFGSALQDSPRLNVVISYDIACQWFVNLTKRIEEYWPEHLKPNPRLTLRTLIPKLHEPGHKKAGHQEFSFNYAKGVGLTDGECPERIWAGHNALGNATKTQGPGSRHDVLDDHFGFWNWLKYSSMGGTLMRRYKAAISERNSQVEGHRGFTASLSEQLVVEWEALCVAWEEDAFPKAAENPYQTSGICLTGAEVLKELAEEEKDRLTSGGMSLHETSAPAFLALGLELEESQHRLKILTKRKAGGSGSGVSGSISQQRKVLRTAIQNWEPLRTLYIPGLLQLQKDMETADRAQSSLDDASTHAEDVPLWLPSSLPSSRLHSMCSPILPEMEQKLRTAQCHDALEGLRHVLCVKTRMVLFKNKNIRGQRDGLRSRAVIDRVHARARKYADAYRLARAALLKLMGPGEWETGLRVLLDTDIRSYSDPDKIRRGPGRRGTTEEDETQTEYATPEAMHSTGAAANCTEMHNLDLRPEARTVRDGTGETQRTLSWIWTTESGRVTEGADSDDILRSEWAKSRARAARATEEVSLLLEEMRRVLLFLEWKARWWIARRLTRPTIDSGLNEGLAAYAAEQAQIQRNLSDGFREAWKTPLECVENDTRHNGTPHNDGHEADATAAAADNDDGDINPDNEEDEEEDSEEEEEEGEDNESEEDEG